MSRILDHLKRAPRTRKGPAEESWEQLQKIERRPAALPPDDAPSAHSTYPMLACGHRWHRPLRPGQPLPPRGECRLCVREAEDARQGRPKTRRLAAEDAIIVDAEQGLLAPHELTSETP